MFGWFRKRRRPEGEAPSTTPTQHEAAAPAPQAPHAPFVVPAPMPAASAPSARPAMPLNEQPNFSGLQRASAELDAPRLLEPNEILSDEARDELTALLADMFGAEGRYRLEWRADRQPGDDAMFSEIMVADMVRRIQNTLGTVAAIEAGLPAPARLVPVSEEERQRAIESFLKPEETLEALVETVTPKSARRVDEQRHMAEQSIVERKIA